MKISNINISRGRAILEYKSLDYLPIIAGGIVEGSLIERPISESSLIAKYLDSAVECGFNTGSIYGNPTMLVNFIKKIGKDLSDKGVKLLLSCSIINQYEPFVQNKIAIQKLIEQIADIDDFRVLFGWDTISEPRYAHLENAHQYYDFIRNHTDSTLETLMPLIGAIQSDFTGPCQTYQEYIESVIEVIPYLTPLVVNIKPYWSSEGAMQCNFEIFYDTLLSLLKVSVNHDRDFWTYCHCMQLYTVTGEYSNSEGMYYTSFSRPSSTLETMRYEVFTALAYGSRGFYFYDYSRRSNNSYDYFGPCLTETEFDGKEKNVYMTPEWYAAKQVISEIKRYQSIFLNKVVVSVKHVDDSTSKTYYRNPQYIEKPIDKYLSIIVSTKDGIVVSRLQTLGDPSSEWLVIVNKSPFAPQRITLTYNKASIPFREETIVKKFIGGENEKEYYFNPSETSAIIFENQIFSSDEGKNGTKVNEVRQLYPGGYIILQLVLPLE